MSKRDKLFGRDPSYGIAGISVLTLHVQRRAKEAHPRNVIDLIERQVEKPKRHVKLRRSPAGG